MTDDTPRIVCGWAEEASRPGSEEYQRALQREIPAPQSPKEHPYTVWRFLGDALLVVSLSLFMGGAFSVLDWIY